MIENHRAILAPHIRPLAIGRGRVVHLPEGVEELFVRDDAGDEFHLDRFGVPGLVRADLLVSGVFGVAAGVADRGIDHAGDGPECGFHAPETAGRKCSCFDLARFRIGHPDEFKRRGIDEIWFAAGRRAVVEDVAEMGVTAGAIHLDSLHAQTVVVLHPDIQFRNRFPETGPAGAGFELGIDQKQVCAAADALVNAGFAFLGQVALAAEGYFRAFETGDAELFWRQNPFPFIGCFDNPVHCPDRAGFAEEYIDFIHLGLRFFRGLFHIAPPGYTGQEYDEHDIAVFTGYFIHNGFSGADLFSVSVSWKNSRCQFNWVPAAWSADSRSASVTSWVVAPAAMASLIWCSVQCRHLKTEATARRMSSLVLVSKTVPRLAVLEKCR